MDDIEDERVSSHTSARMTTRIEVVGRVSGRRRWTVEQKLAILRDAFGSSGSVRAACERHEVGSGAIYTWRRQAMSGELTGVRPPALSVTGPVFSEVEIPEPVVAVAPAPSIPQPYGQIGIELPSGVRLTVDGTVDADVLARVVTVLGR
jgi:transposase